MTAPAAITVTQLNTLLHDILDGCDFLSDITVRGEISNFKRHSSGHLYFSVKDEGSVIGAVMFRASASRLAFLPENGMKVLLRGSVSVYVKGGQYQIYVTDVQPDGVGALHVAFEQLKRKLAAEGLFDPERKKTLPKIPRAVGLITSPTGAAVQDMIRILGARFPFAEVILYPALVQGEGAAASLTAGIRAFNRAKCADVLIIGRGGGSMEDLWAFNDETLARAVAASEIPVISAVGHETDFTICDFVADLRAATPSNAAELAVPETGKLIERFSNLEDKFRRLCTQKYRLLRERTETLAARRCFQAPDTLYRDRRLTLDRLSDALRYATDTALHERRAEFATAVGKLRAMDPLAILSRGYAVALADGKTVKKTGDVPPGGEFTLRLSDGAFTARRISGENREE